MWWLVVVSVSWPSLLPWLTLKVWGKIYFHLSIPNGNTSKKKSYKLAKYRLFIIPSPVSLYMQYSRSLRKIVAFWEHGGGREEKALGKSSKGEFPGSFLPHPVWSTPFPAYMDLVRSCENKSLGPRFLFSRLCRRVQGLKAQNLWQIFTLSTAAWAFTISPLTPKR